MGRPGLEPGTNRLKAEYSTIELATRAFFFFSRTVSNSNTTLWGWQGVSQKNVALRWTTISQLAPGLR